MHLRERILNSKDRVGEILTEKELPEWLEKGESVKVQSISEATRRTLLKECSDEKGDLDLAKFTPALLIETLVDPLNGEPVFSRADRDAVAGKSVIVIERMSAIAMRVCGFTGEAVTEKNFEKMDDSAAPSASRSGSAKRSKKS